MITQTEFCRRLFQHAGYSINDLFLRANRLRADGLIKSGVRGKSAKAVEADEGALLLLAVMSGSSIDGSPAAVRQLSALQNDQGEILGDKLAGIFADPTRADQVNLIEINRTAGTGLIAWTDGKSEFFGKLLEVNASVIASIHGRVIRLLALAMMDRRPGSKAHFEWVKQVVKVGNEEGQEAAEKWMAANPFKGEE